MSTNSLRFLSIDGFLGANLSRSTQPELDAAMLRAYTTARALDYGCSVDDVLKLQERVQAGYAWTDVLDRLAVDNLTRADDSIAAGNRRSAAAFHLHAAACWRLAQAALEEEPSKRLQAYLRQRKSFEQALALQEAQAVGFDILYRDAAHRAWYFPHPSGAAPCVVVWGGADGWCEAFYGSVGFYLERGLSVCLVEIPGQGLARLQHGSYLDERFTDMVSLLLDALISRGAAEQFGVVGHSLGGTMALVAAAADERIVACATNGGSVQLAKDMRKYPRVLERIARMSGQDGEATLRMMDSMQAEDAARNTRAELLCLQGGKDVLVDDAEAEHLVELRGKAHATYAYWPAGVHCMYNHAYERNCILGDWFASRLLTR